MPIDQRPNLFLVGAQKSGTTSLALALDSHPDVFMSRVKEPGWLAFGERGFRFLDGHGRTCRAAQWVVRSEAEYLSLFDDAPPTCRYRGEASTWYLSERGMPERLHEYNPDARIIAILRQPADRAYSAWVHARRDKEEPHEDFADALAAEADRPEPSHLLRYREMGRYVEPLRGYIERFGRDRVLILLYDDLREDFTAVFRRCCEFLQIDPDATRPVIGRHNRSGMPRSRMIHALVSSQRFKNAIRPLLPLRLASRAKQWVQSANLRRMPPIDPAIRARLTAEFADEIRALSRLTDRNLDHWL